VDTTVLGSALLGAAASIICWPFLSVLSRLVFPGISAEPYLRVIVALMVPAFVLESLFSWLRVAGRPGVFFAGSLIRIVAMVSGIIALVGMLGWRVWGVMITSVASIIITLCFLLILWLRSKLPTFNRRLFVDMFKFSLPLSIGMLAMFVLNFGDRFILPHYRPFNDLGIYALAYKVGMLMSTLYGSFQVYWSAQVFQIMKRDDSERIFPRIFTYVVLTISFCALALTVCSGPIIKVLANPAYAGAAAVVPILVMAYYFRAIGDFLRCLFLVAGRPGYDAICNWIGAVVCLGGYALLIPKYGIWGAAIATALAFAVVSIISAVWSYRVRPYRVESRRLSKIGIAIALAIVPYCLLRTLSLPGQIGLAVLSLALFPVALWFLRFLTPGELQASLDLLARLRPTSRLG
jgi:O-antigen/teichoic acid export membrane protein